MSIIWIIVILIIGFKWGYIAATAVAESKYNKLEQQHQAERLKWIGYKKNGEY